MLATHQLLAAESLPDLWGALHRATPFRVAATEVHYLTSLALACDDETISHLLLRKLRLARVVDAAALPATVVRMNSFVEYRLADGPPLFGHLRHPSTAGAAPFALSIASLAGVGLIGLETGQSILWPDGDGRLAGLEVLRVENYPGMSRWLETRDAG